jgi:hypothetical protein
MKTINAALVLGLATVGTGAAAAQWDGAQEMIAAYYNEEMSIPKGWSLSYAGRENGVDVYLFDTDHDVFPQTAFLQVDSQLQRLLCGDDQLKAWVKQGMRARADRRVKQGGKKTVIKGTGTVSCP